MGSHDVRQIKVVSSNDDEYVIPYYQRYLQADLVELAGLLSHIATLLLKVQISWKNSCKWSYQESQKLLGLLFWSRFCFVYYFFFFSLPSDCIL